MEVEVFPLGLIDFETAQQIAQKIVSPEGKLVADKKTNRLIVLDYASKREELRRALSQAPGPSANVKIKVTFSEDAPVQSKSLSNEAGLDAQELKVSRNSFMEQELIVVSGGKGHFRVGTNIPYAEWIFDFGLKRGYWKNIKWYQVGAEMIVEPYVLESKKIRLRFTPEINCVSDNQPQTFLLEQLTTEIIVNDGQEVNLGEFQTSHHDFYSKFLVGFNRLGEQTSIQIRLVPTIEDF